MCLCNWKRVQLEAHKFVIVRVCVREHPSRADTPLSFRSRVKGNAEQRQLSARQRISWAKRDRHLPASTPWHLTQLKTRGVWVSASLKIHALCWEPRPKTIGSSSETWQMQMLIFRAVWLPCSLSAARMCFALLFPLMGRMINYFFTQKLAYFWCRSCLFIIHWAWI